jgi:flagellar motor switch protein FliN/FliY
MRGASAPPTTSRIANADTAIAEEIAKLPAYTRSLLRVPVPVVVTLAAAPHAVQKVLEIGPGALLLFKKPCDEPLSLSVGDHEIAVGEAVKVGEKFGLRITSMVLPDERFERLAGRTPQSGRAAASGG